MNLKRIAAVIGCLVVTAMAGNARADQIAHGHGAYVGGNGEAKTLTFNVVELPDGSVRGHGVLREPSTNSFVHFEVSSFMFVGDSLGVAAEITMAVNAPPSLSVGTTIFFFVNDNDPAADEFAFAIVPPEFGNPTIQEIVLFFLMGNPPPPEVFTPLIAGNFWVD